VDSGTRIWIECQPCRSQSHPVDGRLWPTAGGLACVTVLALAATTPKWLHLVPGFDFSKLGISFDRLGPRSD